MRIETFAVLLMLCVACGSTEAPTPEQQAAQAVDEMDLEAEGEARAEAVAAQLVGQPGPAVTLTTIEGARIDLAELYGKKPVYLKFWATWCVPCRQQMPEFERIYETLGDRLEVISVNIGYSDDEAAVREYLTEIDLKMPIAVDDGSLADLLELHVTPQHVLIGLDGRIAYVGHLDGEPLDRALDAVLSQRAEEVEVVEGVSAEATTALRQGDLVGGLRVATIDGETVSLGAGGGTPRGVLLFSSWCESYLAESRPKVAEDCRAAREEVEKLAAEGERAWLVVSDRLWATEEDLELYRSETQTRVPLALDSTGEIFRAFGVRQIPTIALIDGDGRLERLLGPDELGALGR